MLGTIVNAGAVVLGGGLGLLLKKGLPARISEAIMGGVGLVVLYIGVSGALAGENVLVAVLSVVLGGALGAWMDIDAALNRLGARAQAAFAGGGGKSARTARAAAAGLRRGSSRRACCSAWARWRWWDRCKAG